MPIEVTSQGRVITLAGSLDDAATPARFAAVLQSVIDAGHDAVEVIAEVTGRRLPGVTAALASICGYHRSQGPSIVFGGPADAAALAQYSFIAPQRATLQSLGEARDLFGRVWAFDRAGADLLVEAIAGKSQERLTFAPGVYAAASWVLSELVDNALEHSGVGCGFIEVQANVSAQHLDICVADYGRGLPSADDAEWSARARTLAAPGEQRGAGGLAGLARLMTLVTGRTRIVSGAATLTIDRGSGALVHAEQAEPLAPSLGFVVDVQLGTGRSIEMAAFVGEQEGEGGEGGTETGTPSAAASTFRIAEHARGTATRFAAAEVRAAFEQALANQQMVALDFGRCVVVSSAFADELVGPIVSRLGARAFADAVRLVGMNAAVAPVVRHAIRLRAQALEVNETR